MFRIAFLLLIISSSAWYSASLLDQNQFLTQLYPFDAIAWSANANVQKPHTASPASVRHFNEIQKSYPSRLFPDEEPFDIRGAMYLICLRANKWLGEEKIDEA